MKQYALIGENLGHSISPYIHNLIFKHIGIKGVYSLLDIPAENLSGLIGSLSKPGSGGTGYAGINVTIPHKQNIMPYLNGISPEAERIGAVNTVKICDNAAYGYNTDYYGFGYMLETAGIDISGKNIAVFGSGGASRSAIAYLLDNGAAEINVFSKSSVRFDGLKASFPQIQCNLLEKNEKIHGHIAINTTPVGMFPITGQAVISEKEAQRFEALADIVYNPIETEFIKIGRRLGKATQNGLYMLIGQALKAQEIFQNISIDPQLGEEIYKDIIENKILG